MLHVIQKLVSIHVLIQNFERRKSYLGSFFKKSAPDQVSSSDLLTITLVMPLAYILGACLALNSFFLNGAYVN